MRVGIPVGPAGVTQQKKSPKILEKKSRLVNRVKRTSTTFKNITFNEEIQRQVVKLNRARKTNQKYLFSWALLLTTELFALAGTIAIMAKTGLAIGPLLGVTAFTMFILGATFLIDKAFKRRKSFLPYVDYERCIEQMTRGYQWVLTYREKNVLFETVVNTLKNVEDEFDGVYLDYMGKKIPPSKNQKKDTLKEMAKDLKTLLRLSIPAQVSNALLAKYNPEALETRIRQGKREQ